LIQNGSLDLVHVWLFLFSLWYTNKKIDKPVKNSPCLFHDAIWSILCDDTDWKRLYKIGTTAVHWLKISSLRDLDDYNTIFWVLLFGFASVFSVGLKFRIY